MFSAAHHDVLLYVTGEKLPVTPLPPPPEPDGYLPEALQMNTILLRRAETT